MNTRDPIFRNEPNEDEYPYSGDQGKDRMMEKTVLVLGASGLFGSHAAQAFAEAGWTVRRFRRGSDMAAAAQGAQVIVNGLNPPKYHA